MGRPEDERVRILALARFTRLGYGYAVCVLLIFLRTVEKHLPEEQTAIAVRKQ